jgi:hypothetical protein
MMLNGRKRRFILEFSGEIQAYPSCSLWSGDVGTHPVQIGPRAGVSLSERLQGQRTIMPFMIFNVAVGK